MWFRELHDWDVSVSEAIAIQNRLRKRLVLTGSSARLKRIAGADVHYDPSHDRMVAVVVVVRLPDFAVLETTTASLKVGFPYIPGLLSFREAPALLEAFGRVRTRVQAVLIDGQGTAHPRGFGLACHVGLLLDVPTVGCAKSRLVGTHPALPRDAGAHVPLWHGHPARDSSRAGHPAHDSSRAGRPCHLLEHQGRVVGSVLRTREGMKPVFISPGHKIGLGAARNLVLRACNGFRIPEPLRHAHALARSLTRQGLR